MNSCSMAVYALTTRGARLGARLARVRGADLYVSAAVAARRLPDIVPAGIFTRLAPCVAAGFSRYACHVFIAASGIAVRCVAPLLVSKTRDPAVLVVDQEGRFVVSLLSGHLGGANRLAQEVAATLGAVPVITTATDAAGVPAIEVLARDRGLSVANPDAVPAVNAALAEEEPVALDDPEDRLGLREHDRAELFISLRSATGRQTAPPAVVVSERMVEPDRRTLVLHPPVLYAGLGCRRGAPAADILELLENALAAGGLALAALAGLASVSLKRDESGIHEAARRLGLPVRFFEPRVLAGYSVSSVSPKAREILGIDGVCEPAALAAAGAGAGLVIRKTSGPRVTVAVARTRERG